MVKRQRSIKWDTQALIYFRESIRYIQKDSLQNATRIKQEILEKIRDLSIHPNLHPPDKYKFHNSGNFRAFELYKFRIAYLVSDTEIIIVRIRHTSQEPQEY